jgi:pilus assembly protein TadC
VCDGKHILTFFLTGKIEEFIVMIKSKDGVTNSVFSTLNASTYHALLKSVLTVLKKDFFRTQRLYYHFLLF